MKICCQDRFAFLSRDCTQLNNIDNIGYGTMCGIRGFVCEIYALK